MKNIFTAHATKNGKTWFGHTMFALSISFQLLFSAAHFLIHGLFPFIPIPSSYNFERTIEFLKNKNDNVSK